MKDFIAYSFLQNAMLAAILSSILCGIIGAYIVSRRMVFIGGGITHASFGGIGIAYYLGYNPFLGAVVFSILTGLGIESLVKRGNVRNDSAIAIFWSFGMALGIVFIYLTPGYAPDLMSYLFGGILSVTTTELWWMGILAGVISLFFILFLKPVLYVSFDEEFAKTKKLPVRLLNSVLMIFIALTIVVSIKIVGIILVLALLTIPQNIANLSTRKFQNLILLSIIYSLIGSVSGLIMSYYLGIPSGATIIFFLVALFVVMKVIYFYIER